MWCKQRMKYPHLLKFYKHIVYIKIKYLKLKNFKFQKYQRASI